MGHVPQVMASFLLSYGTPRVYCVPCFLIVLGKAPALLADFKVRMNSHQAHYSTLFLHWHQDKVSGGFSSHEVDDTIENISLAILLRTRA